MNPPCPYCKKTVYPTEKLNCLDKIWHKGCFKCTTCGLKLTMNTYKGYDKMPYCNTHYPHLKATAVRQTVEGARLSNISKQQSQVEYHKQFNMSKGSKVSVADDPETMRQVKVSQQQSNVVYSSHAQKKAAAEQKRPSQDDQPEPDRGAYQQPQAPYQPPPQQQAPYQPPPQPQQDYNQPPPTSYGGGGYAPEPEPEPAPQADYHDPQPQSDLIQFTALYDYDAADADEVSFKEGDLFQGTIIDEGWIEGTVMSGAGGFGMAPRNYFEQM